MTVPRVVQHRPQRDEKVRAKEIADLRHECQRLRRSVARLQKENQRLVDLSGSKEDREPEPAMAEAPAVTARAPDPDACSECGSPDLKSFRTPSGVLLRICVQCKHRQ